MSTIRVPLWLRWFGGFGLGLAACGWLDETTVECGE
jgi:hypothetical protein